MRNYLIFNGKSTKDFGVYISGLNTYGSPERDIETITIEGRNGELTIDNGRFKNITYSYPAFIFDQFESNMEGFRNFLMNQIGYKRLEDTYHPDEYRMAMVKGSISPKVEDNLVAGKFDITFSCKPQRFLKSGEIPIEIETDSYIKNPTLNAAKPLLRVYGYGVLHIGDYNIAISEHNKAYIDIDCEMMDAYYEAENMNSYISVGNNGFPVIEAGKQGITKDNTITKIIVYPRWFVL